MKPISLRTRRLLGVLFLVIAVAIPTFLWFIAGQKAFFVGTASVIVLIAFGLLFLSGRWPNTASKGE